MKKHVHTVLQEHFPKTIHKGESCSQRNAEETSSLLGVDEFTTFGECNAGNVGLLW